MMSLLILSTGDTYQFLGDQTAKMRTAFLSFNTTLDITEGMTTVELSRAWFGFYYELFKHAQTNRVFLLPWELFSDETDSNRGFICENHDVNNDAHLPKKLKHLI